ncbi:MAG: TRAP transporter substrate-binding protein DctP [Bacteriovoracaceae bacterium]|jgi:TRAP-type transport system periplasmic protein|nr:TRAP transporter substrate-binding protein DctP [Bacteriovoracaceae bacterium]
MKAFTIFLIFLSFSAEALTIKIATLAPKNSGFGKPLVDLTKRIKKATKGRIKLKIFYGGIQGEEEDVMRKIRIGNLQGGSFSTRTLGDIHPDIRALEIPYLVNDKEAFEKTVAYVEKNYQIALPKKDLIPLGFFRVGPVYLFTTKSFDTKSEIEKLKFWTWGQDRLTQAWMQILELNSVPLTLADVAISVSTGIVDAAYNTPLGIVALQWLHLFKYMSKKPVSYTFSAFVLSKKAWGKISATDKTILRNEFKALQEVADKQVDGANDEAFKILSAGKIVMEDFDQKEYNRTLKLRTKLVEKLRGNYFSKETSAFLLKVLSTK